MRHPFDLYGDHPNCYARYRICIEGVQFLWQTSDLYGRYLNCMLCI